MALHFTLMKNNILLHSIELIFILHHIFQDKY